MDHTTRNHDGIIKAQWKTAPSANCASGLRVKTRLKAGLEVDGSGFGVVTNVTGGLGR
jgi:hypothetical protein